MGIQPFAAIGNETYSLTYAPAPAFGVSASIPVRAVVGSPFLCASFDPLSITPSEVADSVDVLNEANENTLTGNIRLSEGAQGDEGSTFLGTGFNGIPFSSLLFDGSGASFVAWEDS